MESVILSTPLLLCGYAAAFALCIFSVVKRAGFFCTALAAVLFVAASACALLLGAQLTEVAAAAVALFAACMLPLWRGRGDR